MSWFVVIAIILSISILVAILNHVKTLNENLVKHITATNIMQREILDQLKRIEGRK